MKLVDMKSTDSDRPTMLEQPKQPEYPYGLEINLDEGSLKKLGIDKLPQVGETSMLHAVVRVCRVAQNESDHGSSKSMGLQITEMALEKPKKSDADTIYGE